MTLTRALLIIDPRCIFVEPGDPAAYSPDSHVGWSGDAPMSRRALEGWADRLVALSDIVKPEVIGVVSYGIDIVEHASVARTVHALRQDRGGILNRLPVTADTADALAGAIAAVDFDAQRIVIVTAGRDDDDVGELKAGVIRSTVVAPTVLNAGAVGLRDADLAALSV